MAMDFKLQEKERLVEAAKSDLLMGLKTREVSLCKLKLGKFILQWIRVFSFLLYGVPSRISPFFFFPLFSPTPEPYFSVRNCKKSNY